MQEELNLANLLKEGVKEYGVSLDDHQIGQFLKYMEMLKDWNTRINLTAIEDDRDIIIKHYTDSLSILPYIENKAVKLIDVGTGAGFPGIPVNIARQDIDVTLLDSLDKRVKFLSEVIGALELKNIRAIHGRAEDYGANKEYRESFDISVARAVANLPVLLEYCLPFVKPEGIFIAMKGSNIEEVEASKKALEILGGTIEEVCEITLPNSDMKRNIIIVRKLRHTPTKYPRKAGKPAKEPLV